MSYKTPKSISIYQSPTIDFKTTGTTSIFTTESAGSFVTTDIILISDSVNTLTLPGIATIGWTAPDYDDLVTAINLSFSTPSTFYVFSLTSVNNFIPASTQVIFNVTTGVTATTSTGSIIISGFYI